MTYVAKLIKASIAIIKKETLILVSLMSLGKVLTKPGIENHPKTELCFKR